MNEFLNENGWGGAARHAITPDWSPRQTWRLTKGDGTSAILVHAPRDIPGHDLGDFVRLGETLRAAGLSAPVVHAYDAARRMMLSEDFGDTPIDTPAVEQAGYEAAVDALGVLRTIADNGLTPYRQGYIFKKLALYSDDARWQAAWDEAEAALPPAPHVFSHMDYKAGNLHWLATRAGVRRVGFLDYQAAQSAPYTYDIVNLLEDARRNLDPGLKAALKARFRAGLPQAWQDGFEARYTFTAAQFHARVLGQVRGLANAAPDIAPRLIAYLREEFDHPVLSPLRSFMP